MKFTAIIAMFIILPFTKANSQITKGNWMVGGNISYSSTNTNALSNPSSYTYTVLQISPNIGYFFADKLAGGLLLSYTRNGSSLLTGDKANSYMVGPFIRYYFLSQEKIVNLFAEGSYIYGQTNPSDILKSSEYRFAAGPVIYFNSSVGLEFTLGYNSLKYAGYTGRANTIQFGVSFQIHLKK